MGEKQQFYAKFEIFLKTKYIKGFKIFWGNIYVQIVSKNFFTEAF